MPRPRKNDPTKTIVPHIEAFASRLAAAVEAFTIARITAEIRGLDVRKGARTRLPRKRRTIRCYYPGCKNVAAPRFGMFCAAVHKALPAKKKAAIRADRAAA